jgi:hypothetical protein
MWLFALTRAVMPRAFTQELLRRWWRNLFEKRVSVSETPRHFRRF